MWMVILSIGLAAISGTTSLQFLLSDEKTVMISASFGKPGARLQRSAMYLADTEDGSVRQLWETDRVYSLDHHHSRGYVYYSNYSNIIRQPLDCSGEGCGEVVAEASVVYGLAVDWVHERLYWSWNNGRQSALESAGLDGRNASVVISSADLRRLTGSAKTPLLYQVNLDSYERLMFVLATNSTHDFFIKSNLKDKQLTLIPLGDEKIEISNFGIDYSEKRLYYTNQRDESIVVHSCDYDGGRVQKMETGRRQSWINSLQVFLEDLFIVKPQAAPLQFRVRDSRHGIYAMNLRDSKRKTFRHVMNITDLSNIKHMRVYDRQGQMSEDVFRCKVHDTCPEKATGSWRGKMRTRGCNQRGCETKNLFESHSSGIRVVNSHFRK